MKKLIYLGITALVISIFALSCEKKTLNQEVKSHRVKLNKNESSDSNLKSQSDLKDDKFLIAAINGDVKEYVNLFDLETLLTEESPLSNQVLIRLSETSVDRIPDYLVELACVLAPSSREVLNKIGNNRKKLDIHLIRKNIRRQVSEPTFIKVNTVPRRIIFANNLNIEESESNGCDSCDKTIKSNKSSRLIEMSVDYDVVEQIGGPAGDCAGIQYCGFPDDVFKEESPRNVPYSTFTITCNKVIAMSCFTVNKTK